MKAFFKKYWHALFGLYIFIYLPCFSYLERTVTTDYHLIHCRLDDIIPFCEYFIVPYFFWFAFVAIACVWFFFKSREELIQLALSLIIGMSLTVIFYFIYPNGLGNLRPEAFPRDNIFTDLVRFLYSTDTSTNVCPSLHVYNTIVVVVAVFNSHTFKHHNAMKITVSVIGLLICASTMFLKQHSVIDVIAATGLSVCILTPIYNYQRIFKKSTKKCCP